jgi:hypothetical protein
MNSTTYVNGRYLAEILGHGFTRSSTKNTPGFFLQLRILKRYGEKGLRVDCPQYERTLTRFLASEASVHILRGELKSIGVQVASFAQLDPATPDHVSLVGRQIDVTCELESYDGRLQERWSIARRTLAPEAVRALDEQFGHLLRDGNGQSERAPATPNVSGNAPAS